MSSFSWASFYFLWSSKFFRNFNNFSSVDIKYSLESAIFHIEQSTTFSVILSSDWSSCFAHYVILAPYLTNDNARLFLILCFRHLVLIPKWPSFFNNILLTLILSFLHVWFHLLLKPKTIVSCSLFHTYHHFTIQHQTFVLSVPLLLYSSSATHILINQIPFLYLEKKPLQYALNFPAVLHFWQWFSGCLWLKDD